MEPIKLLAIASGGGHWVQLKRLLPAFPAGQATLVSVQADYAEDVPGYRYFRVSDTSRMSKGSVLPLAVQITRILFTVRPTHVITTGAAPGLIALALAKTLFRSRTMWIDSVANCDKLSYSGIKARRFADVWLTQWEHLSRDDGPEYWGSTL